MGKFKIGDIAVCIKSFDGIAQSKRIHPNPPKKYEEFTVKEIDNSHKDYLIFEEVSNYSNGDRPTWNPAKFKHKTNPLFEAQIDAIEESLVEECEEVLLND